MHRRAFLAGAIASGAGIASGAALAQSGAGSGRIRQGLWRSNFGQAYGPNPDFTFEDMCGHAARLGAHGFDLVGFDDIPLLETHGLKLLLAGPGRVDFLTGVIHPEAFEALETGLTAQIDLCAQHGAPSIAMNAGQLRGLSLEEASDNAVAFLSRIAPKLEAAGVTVCLENVNDRRPDEPGLGREDMAFGHWDWGVDVCERVGSPNVKMICDIYHLQIMDGDVCRRIEATHQWIGHFHVAGVPTRGSLDVPQELDFRFIAETIADTDYGGYVSHEWSPAEGADPLEAIRRSMAVMNV